MKMFAARRAPGDSSRERRITRACRLAGTAACGAIAAIWITSVFWFARWEDGSAYWVLVVWGEVAIGHYDTVRVSQSYPQWRASPRGLGVGPTERRHSVWWPRTQALGPPAFTGSVVVPLWMILAATGAPVALMWRVELRRRRRLRLGACPRCGYDRRGLAADAKCPECGTVTAPASK